MSQSAILKYLFLSTTTFVAAGTMMIPSQAQAVDDYADWDGVTITQGSGTVTDTGLGSTTIDQHSMRAVGEAQELHIGTMGDVKINQNSKDALFVGRVVGDHDDPTQILGKLSADGRVMIIDRNGVFFGANSRVDAAGIAVTTGDVSDEQIMSGSENLTFENFGDGEIVLEGTMNVTDAGLAAFVSPVVKNNGVITAKMGHVVMASGDKVTLDLYGDGLVEVAVEGELGKTLLENKGTIDAEGGSIQMTASSAKDVVDAVVNNEGVLSASSATVEGGKIILSGGDNGAVNVAGVVDASGTTGGDISVTGKTVTVTETGKIKNTGANAKTLVKGKDKATFKGELVAGENSSSEISGDELELGGTLALGEGSEVSFDPVTLVVGAGEAATFVSALNNNGVTVNVEAQDQIIVNSAINSSGQSTNSTLHFKDENADSNLQVDLNAKIKLGANQTLTGEATQVNVASTGSIQNGVDVSANGATIDVAAGTYVENVQVNKSVTLNGANAGKAGDDVTRSAETIVDPTSKGFVVTADDVTIDGFEIVSGYTGIQVDDGDNVAIQNNKIHGQFHPNGEGNGLSGFGQGDAIAVQNTDGTTIKSNLVEDYNDDGIQIQNVSNIEVADNVVNDNGNGDEGIAVAGATGTVDITGNTVTNARRDGVQVINTTGVTTIAGNTITGSTNSGVNFNNVKGGATIDDNTITGGAYGVDVVNSRDVTIGDTDANNDSGNTITGTNVGVKISGTSIAVVQDNTIDAADAGIQANDSRALTFQANNIISGSDGVRLLNGVTGGNRVFIYDNIINAGGNGVLIQGNIDGASIVNIGAQNLGNTIVAAKDGVRLEGSVNGSRLRISDSSITGGDDGVQIDAIGDDGVAAVWYNTQVVGNGGSGVEVGSITTATAGSGLAVVGNQLVQGGVQDGITLGNVSGANVGIVDNHLIQGQRHGVNFLGTVAGTNVLIGEDGVDIFPSVITSLSASGDAVHFDKAVTDSTITVGAGSMQVGSTAASSFYAANALKGVTLNSGNDGIGFEGIIDGSELLFAGNDINSGDNGLEFLGALNDTNVTITGNTIDASNDGVDFDNSITGGHIIVGSTSTSLGNTITSGQTGVEFGKRTKTTLTDTVIDVLDNTIDAGIHGTSTEGDVDNTAVTISGNDIIADQRGVSVANGDLKNGTTYTIADNTNIIGGATGDGILLIDSVAGGASATISGNGDPVGLTGGISGGDDGIDARDIESLTISGNYIHDAGGNGIRLKGSNTATIEDNAIYNNGSSGVYMTFSPNVTLTNNTLAQNVLYGLFADGSDNGALSLAGNVFLDNPTGARFESGVIDVSDTSNPNSFIFSSGFPVPVGGYLTGMQFAGSPLLLSIAGETLGATIFDGFAVYPVGDAYYVRFENGSILDTGTALPIVIDGTFASWDGVIPNAFGNILTTPQLQSIEDRLFDADDAVVNGRGQIFVGTDDPTVPPTNPDDTVDTFGALNNFEDFFREFDTPEDQSNRASLRVLGLPPIELGANAPATGPTAFNLNDIAPAAGEQQTEGAPETLAAITPQAGAGENPAPQNVEPQAGEPQVTCVGDAVNSLQNGAVTYNFGGTFEDSLVGQSACSSAQGT